MKPFIVYNASLVIGVASAGIGAWLSFGPGVGLQVAGGLVIALAILNAPRRAP